MGWCSGGWKDQQRVRHLTEQHLRAAEAAIEAIGIPSIEVNYVDYLKAPHAVAARIGRFFDVNLSADDLNVRPDLDHSRLKGRLSTRLRSLLKRLPRRVVRQLEHVVPRRVIAHVFSEQRYVAAAPCRIGGNHPVSGLW